MAWVDGRPVIPSEGEGAREAALREVMTGLHAPRNVDIHAPSGVVLHAHVEPGGRIQVLGQSQLPPDVDRARPAEEATRVDAPAASAHDTAAEADAPLGDAQDADPVDEPGRWPGRDQPWPSTDDLEDDDDDLADLVALVDVDVRGDDDAIADSAQVEATARDDAFVETEPVAPGAHVAGTTIPDNGTPDEKTGLGADAAASEAHGAVTPSFVPSESSQVPRGQADAPLLFPSESSEVRGDGPVHRASPVAEPARPPNPLIRPGHGSSARTRRTNVIRVAKPVAGVVLAAGVIIVGIGGWSKLSTPDTAGHSAAAAAQPFPGSAPDGHGDETLWTGPILLRDSLISVSGEGDDSTVVYVAADRSVQAADSATGTVRWRIPLPAGEIGTGPATTRIDGAPAVLVRVGDRVLAWAVVDGRQLADVTIPGGSSVHLDGPAPLVRIDASAAGVVHGSGLATVALPSGSRAIAARGDGSVLAASGAGWWHLSPQAAPGNVTPWEQMGAGAAAAPATTRVVGAVGSAIVLLDDNPEARRLLVHHDGDTDVRPSFQGEYVPGRTTTWAPSPSGTWGIFGRTLVDVEAGSTTDLGDWETVVVTETHAYGFVGDVLHRAAPGQAPTPVGNPTALIEASTPEGSVVRAETPAGPRFWLLSGSGRP